jgi:hypothetical protein
MIELQNQLISEAKATYGEIFPCGEKTKLSDCFTYEETLGKLVFWFNVAADRSTRALTLAVKEV